MAGCAAGRVERFFSTKYVWIIHVAPGGRAKVSAVECHQVQSLIINFEPTVVGIPMWGGAAV